MNKEFIPYAEALELKELGFNGLVNYYYSKSGKLYPSTIESSYEPVKFVPDYFYENFNTIVRYEVEGTYQNVTSAPTLSQAFRWFREKYGLYSNILPKQKDLGLFYGGGVYNTNGQVAISYGSQYSTYEEAELACLVRLIAIAKRMELAKVAAKEVSEMKSIEDVANDTANWIDKMVLEQMIEIAKTK